MGISVMKISPELKDAYIEFLTIIHLQMILIFPN